MKKLAHPYSECTYFELRHRQRFWRLIKRFDKSGAIEESSHRDGNCASGFNWNLSASPSRDNIVTAAP